MNQNSFKPYVESELPAGFKYPDSYLKLSKNLEVLRSIHYFPWWFSDAEKSLKEEMEIYYNLTGQKDLIEFARDGDWGLFFDANDHSGDPKVLVYDLGNRENHYEATDFDSWLNFVIKKNN